MSCNMAWGTVYDFFCLFALCICAYLYLFVSYQYVMMIYYARRQHPFKTHIHSQQNSLHTNTGILKYKKHTNKKAKKYKACANSIFDVAVTCIMHKVYIVNYCQCPDISCIIYPWYWEYDCFPKTPFTQYYRLSSRLYNGLFTAGWTAGCTTGMTTGCIM